MEPPPVDISTGEFAVTREPSLSSPLLPTLMPSSEVPSMVKQEDTEMCDLLLSSQMQVNGAISPRSSTPAQASSSDLNHTPSTNIVLDFYSDIITRASSISEATDEMMNRKFENVVTRANESDRQLPLPSWQPDGGVLAPQMAGTFETSIEGEDAIKQEFATSPSNRSTLHRSLRDVHEHSDAGGPDETLETEEEGDDNQELEKEGCDPKPLLTSETRIANEHVIQRLKNVAKEGLPRTAREYWAREMRNNPQKQRHDLAWKLERMAQIYPEDPDDSESGHRTKRQKLNKAQEKTRELIHTLCGHRDSSIYHGTTNSEVEAVVTSSKKGTFLKELLEKFPELDARKTATDYNALVKASRSFGLNRMPKAGNGWLLKGSEYRGQKLLGLKTPVLNHQLKGVSEMVERECCLLDGTRGGFLADEMGSGKTLQALAVIAANPGNGPTLIVVPPGVLWQWVDEIKEHTHFKPWVFQDGDVNATAARLAEEVVVLTTYTELKNSLPYPDPAKFREWENKPVNGKSTEQRKQAWIDQNMHTAGVLHQTDWYRIIIDEAHNMKRYKGRLQRAATALEGKHVWLLTGTPVMNQLGEFYALFCILKDPFVTSFSYSEFTEKFCNVYDERCIAALQLALSNTIIRRQKHETVLGKAIVDLPKLHRSVIVVGLRPHEQLLHQRLREKFAELRKQKLEEDDERKDLKNSRAQYTRLRQFTANVDIPAEQLMKIFTPQELKDINGELKGLDISEKDKPIARILIQRLVVWIREQKAAAKLDASSAKSRQEDSLCMDCKDPDDDLIMLKKCKHIFCKSCIDGVEMEEDDHGEVGFCPKCETAFKRADIKSRVPRAAQNGGRPKKAKDARGYRPPLGFEQTSWLNKLDEGSLKIFPSAKLTAVMTKLAEWMQAAPKDKVIIFTQWKPLLVMLAALLENKKIKFVYFTGNMTHKQRHEALQKMKRSDDINVMIASLKAGGTGLNLQFANRMISICPWWNSAAEAQAMGRIHRYGQKKETWFTQIVVRETIDMNIIELQIRKNEMIGDALHDEAGSDTPADANLAQLLQRNTKYNADCSPDGPDYEELEYECFLESLKTHEEES